MRVVVVGAGVVGVTTAYYLARSGHQVTVVEKAPEAATLASAGNAGLIAPGHSFAWASPSAPKELLRSLTVEDTALRVNPLKAPGMAVWGLRFLRECNAERAVKNTLVKLRLAQYSQRMLDQIAADEHIDYDDMHEGILYLYRDPKRFEAGVKKMKLVQEPRSSTSWRAPSTASRIRAATASNSPASCKQCASGWARSSCSEGAL